MLFCHPFLPLFPDGRRGTVPRPRTRYLPGTSCARSIHDLPAIIFSRSCRDLASALAAPAALAFPEPRPCIWETSSLCSLMVPSEPCSFLDLPEKAPATAPKMFKLRPA